jgi:hypothetical protein
MNGIAKLDHAEERINSDFAGAQELQELQEFRSYRSCRNAGVTGVAGMQELQEYRSAGVTGVQECGNYRNITDRWSRFTARNRISGYQALHKRAPRFCPFCNS